MRSIIASILNKSKVWKASSIYMAALCCIFLSILRGYTNEALLYEFPQWIPKHLHILNSWYCFVHIKVDMLLKCQLFIEDKFQISLHFFRIKDRIF